MVNVDFTPSKMTNVENVADCVSFQFTNGYYTFHATVISKETAERQQLTLLMTSIANESTGYLTLELQDLRPPSSERQPDRDGMIAQLELKLRVAQDEDKLLNTKLLVTEGAREKERS